MKTRYDFIDYNFIPRVVLFQEVSSIYWGVKVEKKLTVLKLKYWKKLEPVWVPGSFECIKRRTTL